MIMETHALWLSVSPHLKRFDQRLMGQLARTSSLACWEYQQGADEPCSIEIAVTLLHDYLKQQSQPYHLLGHGISGIVGFIYASRFPHRVKSLTLLSVAAPLSHTWHAHYYATRELLPCSRGMVLAQMARLMFGPQPPALAKAIVRLLAKDLDSSLTPHSLFYRSSFGGNSLQCPLMVALGAHDLLIDIKSQQQWQATMGAADRLWQCSQGRHFFHYDYPSRVAEQITAFWQNLPAPQAQPATAELRRLV